jgi:hypothetical protein
VSTLIDIIKCPSYNIGMARPALSAVTELFKPITWFPPMWAFACGVVASGMPMDGRWGLALIGVALAGPLVCATSQAVNDWFDRHVDAINEPHRPIPSGRIPGRWGLYLAIAWTGVSLLVATALGPWGVGDRDGRGHEIGMREVGKRRPRMDVSRLRRRGLDDSGDRRAPAAAPRRAGDRPDRVAEDRRGGRTVWS